MAIDESQLLGALADSNIYDNVGITNTLPEFPITSISVKGNGWIASVFQDMAFVAKVGENIPIRCAGPRNPDEMYAHAVDLLRKVENRQLPISKDDVRGIF